MCIGSIRIHKHNSGLGIQVLNTVLLNIRELSVGLFFYLITTLNPTHKSQ